MKKTLSKGLLCGLIFFTYQSAEAQKLLYGVFAGPQTTSAKFKIEEEEQPNDYVAGMQKGLTMKVPFENNLYFSSAIYYSHKGYKVKLNRPSLLPSELAKNTRTSLHTIELAPLLQYDFSKKPAHFFVKLGPAIDFAFFGWEKFDTEDGKQVSRQMKFSVENDYGPFTAQGILHFGYESAKGLIVFAHFAEGMGGLSNTDGGPTIKHRIAGLSLGWYFGKRPKGDNSKVKG